MKNIYIIIFILFLLMGCTSKGIWFQTTENCTVWNPNPKPPETATWSGKCLNGKVNGYGTLSWSGGDKYTGNYKGGKKCFFKCSTSAKKRVAETPLNSCYRNAKSEGTTCIMMYWGNSAGQSQCRDWQRNHEKLCYNLYNNPKPITQKIANCINKANEQKRTCNLLNYGKPVGLQNCTRSKFRSIEHCYYINQ